MPDLNFDNPRLREEIFKIGRFWLAEVGVDGFRMDAARHIFPDERAVDNHNWWIYFLSEMQKVKKDVYIVGEVWAPADVVAPYMKGIPALFNFDLGYAITKALNEQHGDSIAINLSKTRDFYKTVNPGFIDATFLTNHDQTRIMNAVGDDENKARMAAALLFTLPGSPYIYYGEEIGMKGKKPDQNIREPFLWDIKANDKQRASWIKPLYSTDSTVIPESRQVKDKTSMLNFYKTLIALRNNSPALTYGEIEPVNAPRQLSVFKRTTADEALLVLHNLSSGTVSFDLTNELQPYNKSVFNIKGGKVVNGSVRLPAYASLILGK
jgi:glycosidase